MSTRFDNEGNLGSAPEYHEFPNGDGEEPDRMLRVSVFFDNPVRINDAWEDRGGFWLPVELRHPDAQKWIVLYQKGMRVAVRGHLVSQKWIDEGQQNQVTMKVRARAIAILPNRIETITVSPKTPPAETSE